MKSLKRAVIIAFTATQLYGAQRSDDRPERQVNWRREAVENMRVAAAGGLISQPEDLRDYVAAGFNTLNLFDTNGCNDAGTAWNVKSEEQIERETSFAREHGLPIILGLAVEPFVTSISSTRASMLSPAHQRSNAKVIAANGTIPQASDDEIRERVALWNKYGSDVIIGAFPWYDDVFWMTVDVERQHHVYRLMKSVAPEWYVFGMIGEFGFDASDETIARYYDPAAFDHLIVLMYPYNVGGYVTGFPLDNIASSDPDGDLTHYIDRFMDRMNERFFSRMRTRQLVVMCVQAFYWTTDYEGRIPRAQDIDIMMRRASEDLRKLNGQKNNRSASYYWWGVNGSGMVGLSQRPDWLQTVRALHADLDRVGLGPFQP